MIAFRQQRHRPSGVKRSYATPPCGVAVPSFAMSATWP